MQSFNYVLISFSLQYFFVNRQISGTKRLYGKYDTSVDQIELTLFDQIEFKSELILVPYFARQIDQNSQNSETLVGKNSKKFLSNHSIGI